VALVLVFFWSPDDMDLLVALPLVFLVGVFTAHQTEKDFGKDSGRIVIDELCGYLASVVFLPRTPGYLIAAFFIFRVFDVIKPPPVRTVERLVPGGAGVMLDDVLAGVYSNICLQLWVRFSGG
jgi:phosphatidylglycerophosphatase A